MTHCITNQVDDLRSCTHRGSHTDECDGIEWVWIDKHGREESTGKVCRGCAPRRAVVGLTCAACFDRIIAAVAAAPALTVALASIDRAVTPDGGGRSSSAVGYVPIPATALAVDEITRYLAGRLGTTEQWVSTPRGAEEAVRLAAAVKAASLSFPLKEAPHALKRTRCPECSQLTFVWNPPAVPGGKVIVKCRDPKCGRIAREDAMDDISGIESAA